VIPIIDALAPIVSKILDFIPDPQKKAEAHLKLQQELDANSQAILAALTSADRAQAETNTEEAKSSNFFVAGWRPFIGWTCGAAFAWAFVIQPILVFVLVAAGRPIPTLPVIAIGEMMPVLLGMLGLAGMRSWEKSQGVHNEH
jgi:hypothetical protein